MYIHEGNDPINSVIVYLGIFEVSSISAQIVCRIIALKETAHIKLLQVI
jgi:hypothetical protein